MFDKLIAFHTLELIRDSLELIEKRCSDIYSVDDFLLSDSGMMKLDSVCICKESGGRISIVYFHRQRCSL